jgi:hypothetical protein
MTMTNDYAAFRATIVATIFRGGASGGPPMTTMIEQVARAIQEADVRWYSERFPTVTPEAIRSIAEDEFSGNYNALARAAIEAMRQPTDAMLVAGLEREAAWVAGDCGDSDSGPLVSTQVVYEAMIDAALEDQEAG